MLPITFFKVIQRILMKYKIIVMFIALTPLFVNADEFSTLAEKENVFDHVVHHGWSSEKIPIALQVSGYIKAEAIFDSRQNFTERSGHYLYFPLEIRPDVLGNDINSRGDFDEYAIQSRLRVEGFGPDIGCMDSRSYIEGDFFGKTNATIASFRLRHAYLTLESENFNFLAGQTWHPISIPIESPDTISFNTGAPLNPYSRNPQFRFTYHNDQIDIMVTALGWIGDRPFGPLGPDSKYFRDAIMPDINVQARFKWNEDNYIGAGFDVMRIVPRLATNLNYKEIQPFTSLAATAYTKFSSHHLILYCKGAYVENAVMWNMIGGYGIHTLNPASDIRTYTPLRTAAFWAELIFDGSIEPALFIGFAKNLGAKKSIIHLEDEQSLYGIGTNINTVFRVAPRVRWYIKSLVLGTEIEYTRATYGIPDNFGRVKNTIPVGNVRFLLATYYIF